MVDLLSEKEKCRLGLLYDANYDPEILVDRERAKELLYDYNHLRPSEQIGRTELLKKLLGKTGENLIVEPPFTCDYGYNIEVGENFYANVNLVILDGAKVRIGDNAFIAPPMSAFIRQDIHWTHPIATRAWSMLTRSRSEIMSGSVPERSSFLVLQ